MNKDMLKLEVSLIGLVTCTVPISLHEIADGYEKGTRPLNKDEVINQLRVAADNIQQLNSALLKVVDNAL